MTMTMSGCHPRALWVPRRHEGAMGNSVSFTPPHPKKKSTPINDLTLYQVFISITIKITKDYYVYFFRKEINTFKKEKEKKMTPLFVKQSEM